MASPTVRERVTAVKNKSSVTVLSWGGPPFALETTKHGYCYVPSGFLVEVKSDGCLWLGETKVLDDTHPEYRFTLKGFPSLSSSWKDNPTAAYKEANHAAQNPKYSRGSNGRLILGVHYENLQAIIRRRFEKELKSEFGDPEIVQRQLQTIKAGSSKRAKRSKASERELSLVKRVKQGLTEGSPDDIAASVLIRLKQTSADQEEC